MTTDRTCSSCQHSIDAAARICPYCGADPDTGQKIDVKPLVEAHFPPRPQIGPVERVAQALRARQGIVATSLVLASIFVLTLLYQFVARRNAQQVSDVPAVPLTEITDLNRQTTSAELPIPELEFAYDGNVKSMQTYIIEPGAVAPAPPPGTTAAATAPGTPAGAPVTPGLAVQRPAPVQQPLRPGVQPVPQGMRPMPVQQRPVPAPAAPPRQ